MSRGRFIAFEGGEGSGKSTQARLLADALQQTGLEVQLTREPGGTPGAEAIRELLLHPEAGGWGVRTEALLFAAARSDHVEKLIEPALAAGHWVVCDRFVDSSRAYQGGAGQLGDERVMALHDLGSEGLLPDLTLLIDLASDFRAKRLANRDGENQDAIGGRGQPYHARVAAAFQDFARAEPERFRVIDGSGSIEEVQRRIMVEVGRLPGATHLS